VVIRRLPRRDKVSLRTQARETGNSLSIFCSPTTDEILTNRTAALPPVARGCVMARALYFAWLLLPLGCTQLAPLAPLQAPTVVRAAAQAPPDELPPPTRNGAPAQLEFNQAAPRALPINLDTV